MREISKARRVSIPDGAIKGRKGINNYLKEKYVSIPDGAIKGIAHDRMSERNHKFQFQMVRLKEAGCND